MSTPYSNANPLLLIFNTIYYSNPLVFYVIIGAIVSAAVLAYFENFKAGLILTIILSAFFYAIGMFIPYVLVPMVLAFILMIADLLGFRSIGRYIENIGSWIYLSIRLKKRGKQKAA